MPNEWGEPTPEEVAARKRAEPRMWEMNATLCSVALLTMAFITVLGQGMQQPWLDAGFSLGMMGVVAYFVGGVAAAHRSRGRRGVVVFSVWSTTIGVFGVALWWWVRGGLT